MDRLSMRYKDHIALYGNYEDSVFSCLRKMRIPMILKMIVHATSCDFAIPIERVRETDIEGNQRMFKQNKMLVEQKNNYDKNRFKFYKRGKVAHLSRDRLSDKVMRINNSTIENPGLDICRVCINGIESNAIFDTDAVSSFICSGAIKSFPNLEMINKKTKFRVLDNHEICSEHVCQMKIESSGKEIQEEMYLVDSSSSRDIVIGNKAIKKLFERPEEISIVCEIKTLPDPIVC